MTDKAIEAALRSAPLPATALVAAPAAPETVIPPAEPAPDATTEPNPHTGAIEQVKVRVLPDGRMSRADAARYLGINEKTLANWALVARGPPPHRVGGRVFYYREACDAFIQGDAAA